MITCAKCQRENEDHFNFCLGCGSNLQEQKTATGACSKCGAPNPSQHMFCGTCGNRLRVATGQPKAVDVGVSDEGEQRAAAAAVSSEPSSKAQLVLINPDGSTGETISLNSGENVFGRSHGPPVFQEDPFLSPKHVCFRVSGASLELEDLASRNGVFYRITQPAEITHGAEIRIGRQLLRFHLLSKLSPVLPKPKDSGTKLAGSPTGPAWARLIRVSEPSDHSISFLLSSPEEVIGRERGSVVLSDDGFISSRHARITVDAGRYFLEDLRSSNGTFLRINGKRTLRDGDLLLMGQQPLRAFISAS
ncbi:MAG: FHA domain-containing protein [Myxococcales bacterium]|nr:FHA domain-containing protein [Myxococcales bacterium]